MFYIFVYNGVSLPSVILSRVSRGARARMAMMACASSSMVFPSTSTRPSLGFPLTSRSLAATSSKISFAVKCSQENQDLSLVPEKERWMFNATNPGGPVILSFHFFFSVFCMNWVSFVFDNVQFYLPVLLLPRMLSYLFLNFGNTHVLNLAFVAQ